MFKIGSKTAWLALALTLGIVGSAVSVKAFQASGASGRDDAARHAEYLWVRNSEASTALANGDVVEWYDGTTVDGLEVKLGSTGDQKLVAGVAIGAVAAGEWGFIQVRGYHSAIKIATANSAGDGLSIGATSGKAKSDNTAGMDNFGVALEATTSSTTVKGFIYR